MKAKDIAKAILGGGEDAALDALIDLLNGAVALAKQRRSEEGKLAVFREAFQKWRAVCALISATPEGLDAGLSMFTGGLQAMSKELFAACVKGRVFLSHTLNPEDQAVYQAVLDQHAAQRLQESVNAGFRLFFAQSMRKMLQSA